MTSPFEPDFEFSKSSPPERGDSISLAFLFYVTTMSGIVAGCARMAIGNEFATWPIVWITVGSVAVLGFILGNVIGLHHSRTITGTLIGGGFGTILGLVAGLVALIPAKNYFELMNVAFIGTWVLIVLMLVMARFQSQPNL